jgi:ABC-type branched-subunit amino acid transport system ATPase component
MLVATGITSGYRGDPVLRDVAITVPDGITVAVLGPNGAGKSTLFKTLIGLLPLQGGSVRLGDLDVSDMPPYLRVRSGLGYVPQLGRVFPSLSVRENLEMGGFTLTRELPGRIDEVLELFPDLHAALKQSASNLSGGQQTMLGMARALILKPKIMLLDEPTAGLSPLYAAKVWESIRSIAGAGIGVLTIEQNVTFALEQSDEAYVLVDGQNTSHGRSAELKGRSDVEGLFVG